MSEDELADLSGFVTGTWEKPEEVHYNRKDVLLYAVGIGCGEASSKHYNDLQYVYEQEPNFTAFPTFPVSLPFLGVSNDVDTPGSSDVYLQKAKATQGPFKPPEPGIPRLPIKGVKVGVDYERYIVKLKDIPLGARMFFRKRLYGVTQKKSGAVVEHEEEMIGEDGTVYYRFISGGFQIGGHGFKNAGKSNSQDIPLPDRAPDYTDEMPISPYAHLVYRLCGDYNPLHLDPESVAVKRGGFPAPILMGLCTLGYVTRQVLRTCASDDPGRFRAIKVRFASPVLPGQTLLTQMWDEGGGRILFVAKIKETGKTVISNAFVELIPQARL